jgi:hypothetical protein
MILPSSIASVCAIAFLVIAWGATLAEAVVKSGTLGQAGADIYSLQCGSNTAAARADVFDLTGGDGAVINVCVVNPLGRAACKMAPDGDASTIANLSSGAGNYLVVISRADFAGGTQSYETLIECRTSSGALATHTVLQVQNQ